MAKQELLSVPTERVRPSDVKKARFLSFQKQQSGELTYEVDRGAFGYDPDFAYKPSLPTFCLAEGGKPVDYKMAIADSIRTGGKARVLDIGCGTGRFLRDLRKHWGEATDLVGISAFDWRSKRLRRKDAKKGINYLICDAQRLSRWPPSGFDVVVSVRSMQYMADPIAVIKGAYHVLKPGGFAFLDVGDLPDHFAELEDYDRLVSFLQQEYNFQFKGNGLAFCKTTNERLILPLNFAGQRVDEEGYPLVTYTLNLNSTTSPSCTE